MHGIRRQDRKPGGGGAAALTYAQEVLADSPVLYWPLDEPSGTTVTDHSSGGNNDGTLVNGPALGEATVRDAGGTSIRFNDTNLDEYCEVATFTGFPTTNITFEAWIGDMAGFNTNGVSLIDYATTGSTSDFMLWVGSTTTESTQFKLYINGSNVRFTSGPNASTANTYKLNHYVVTWRSSDGRAQLWIDGKLWDTQTIGAAHSFVASGHLMTNQFQSPKGTPLAGRVSRATYQDVAIYPSVLSDARILAHYLAGRAVA